MRRTRRQAEAEAGSDGRRGCTCADCRHAEAIAQRTREFPGAAVKHVLEAFAKCPRAGAAYRRGIRPFVRGDAAATAELDADSFADASTVDGDASGDEEGEGEGEGAPTDEEVARQDVPALDDLPAWRRFRNYARLQARWTPHSNERNIRPHPFLRRLRTVFTDTRHDYYLDDQWLNQPGDPACCLSPSVLKKHLYADFQSGLISRQTAESRLLAVFQAAAPPPAAAADGPRGRLDRCWDVLAEQRRRPEKLRRFWEAVVDTLEFSDAAVVRRLAADFDACLRLGMASDQVRRDLLAALTADVVAAWDDARTSGSRKHGVYDHFVQHEPFASADDPASVHPPVGFLRSMADITREFDIFGSEVPMAHQPTQTLGVADLICQHRTTGELHVFDFKNCKDADLGKEYGSKRGIHPLTATTPATKLNEYKFQLSFYYYILNTWIFPGRFSRRACLLNYRPAAPDEYDVYWFDVMDLTAFFAHLPFRAADPWHQLPAPARDTSPALIPLFAPDDPRAAAGPTTRARIDRGAALPADAVWSGAAVKSAGYPALERSPWCHPTARWFGEPGPHVAASYEDHLVRSADLLRRLPDVVGKRVLCWCPRTAAHACNADVIVRYANLLHAGAFALPGDAGAG